MHVISRDYHFPVYEKENTTTFAYVAESVYLIIVSADDSDFTAWETKMSEELGEPKSKNSSGESQENTWSLSNNIIVSLKSESGKVSIEISPVS